MVFGEASLQREIALLQKPVPYAVNKLAIYAALAEQTQEATYGANLGGEQPKFLWHNVDTGSVLVKFAPVGSRMASLLPMEHLALRTLREFTVPAAITQVYFSDLYVFLEVVRFDRMGSTGRKGLLSAAAIDDKFFGLRGNWSEFAQRCRREGYLREGDIDFVHTLAAFSELIGNKDRHLENISVLIDDEGNYAGMAPAYDILPMDYATRGGVEPDLIPISPSTSIGVPHKIWSVAARAANRFWEAVATEELGVPISGEFRELARINQHRAAELAGAYLRDT